jgi:hypothetical protein
MTAPSDQISLRLTISGDERFVVTSVNVAERVAFHVGRPEKQAREIGAAVEAVIAQIVQQEDVRRQRPEISLEFTASAERMEVEIGYDGRPDSSLEESLQRKGSAGMDVMRRAFDRVEFHHADGRALCRLTRGFPDVT